MRQNLVGMDCNVKFRGLLMIGMVVLIGLLMISSVVSSVSANEKKEKKNVWIFTQPLFYDQFKPLVEHLVGGDEAVVTMLTPFDASDAMGQFLPSKRKINEDVKFNLVKCPIDTKIPVDFYSSIVESAGKKQTYFEYASYLKHQWIDKYFGKSFFKCGTNQLEKSKVDVVVADCHAYGAFDFAHSFSKPLVILCPTLAGLSTLQPMSHQSGKELFEPRFNPFNQVAYLKFFNQLSQVEKTSSFATTLNFVTQGQFSKQNSTDFIRTINQENLVGQYLNALVNMVTHTQYHAFWLYELFLNNRRSEYLPLRIADDISILDIVKNAHVFYTSISDVTEDVSLQIPSNAHLIPPLLNLKQTKWINLAEKRLSEVKTIEKKMENRNVILVNLRDTFKLLPVFLNNLETLATKHNHLVVINKNSVTQELISKYPSFAFSDLQVEERNRILKSANIKFVITSGDLLSTSEAIAHGKPILMVPSTTEGFSVSLRFEQLKVGHVLIPSFTNDKVIQSVLSNFFRNTELHLQLKNTRQYSELFSEGSNMSVNILSSYILSLASTKTTLSPSHSFDTKASLIVDASIVALCILLTFLTILYVNIRIFLHSIRVLLRCCCRCPSSKNSSKKEKTD